MAASKKKVIKSLESLSDELKELLRDQYPNGYESSITRITNAKREPIFVFPLESEDATYLVKVPVTKNSDGEYDVESKPETEFEAGGNEDAVPTSGGGDFESPSDEEEGGSSYGRGGDEDDYEEGGKRGREASYDPDFDN
jgi:hypothetical protein